MPGNTHCFVPGCKTGYASTKPKVQSLSLFTPPIARLSQWSAAIPRADRQLSRRDRVCELHFAPQHIIRDFVVKVGEDTVALPREKPKLTSDAVPTIFPNLPEYMTRVVKPPRRIITKHTATVNIEDCDVCPSAAGNTDELRSMTFSDLTESHKLVLELCPKNWVSVVGENCVCFAKMVIENSCMHCLSCVTISSDMNVSLFYRNAKILNNFDTPGSQQQLLSVIHFVDSMKECRGATGVGSEKLNGSIVHSRLGRFDTAQHTWRHINCAGLLPCSSPTDRCLGCKRYRKVLQTACKQRNPKVMKRSRCYVRLKQIHLMRKKIASFRATVSATKQKLREQMKRGIDEHIKMLPPNQQMAFRHCVQQASVKSPRGMRYEHQWILGCMLLRIKSPTAYNHLREHEILSLPSKSTLQRYLDVVRAECGISQECLDLLQKKVSCPADQHGILLFDELKLRTGIKFDVKNLTFSGLVNVDEFTPVKERSTAADYGLVFMYRPFRGSWTQTVAMFLSKGPTRSSVLSKLMMKVIIALESLDLWVCLLFIYQSIYNFFIFVIL